MLDLSEMKTRFFRIAILATAAACLLPTVLEAQYFGRNKVQYDDFDFRVMETNHFDIHFYPEEEEAVRDAARMAERWYSRLSGALAHEFTVKRPIVLYANHPDFQQTNVISGQLGEGTGGVTEGLKNRVVMPFTGTYAGTDHVLGHELVHAFQYSMAGGGRALANFSRLPLWIVEGMAEYLSVGRTDSHTAMWLRDATLRDDLPTLDQLTRDPRYFPYRFGQAFWAYIGGRHGDAAVGQLFRGSLRYGFEDAVEEQFGITSDSLSQEWIAAIRADYGPLLEDRVPPRDVGDRIIAEDVDAGEMNVGPAVSPDGRYVAFLSELDLFTIDLYLANAETGEVIRQLASSTTDGHIDALSFIESAGTWSPDGSRFAFVTITEGDNHLAIADVESGGIVREIEVPGVDGIRDPAWSPDGRQLAITGIVGGVSDLYLVDLGTGSAEQLTSGRNAEIQPRWSPDGQTLVFATDRSPETDFDRLTYDDMRLGFLDVGTREVETLELFEDASHLNPHYSPDGSELYFVSDREGFSDVYRLEIESGDLFQVTRIATGVSGITQLAPALSVASSSGRVMFSVFEEGNYAIHGLSPEQARGTPVGAVPTTDLARAGLLPPIEAFDRGLVGYYLDRPEEGLPGRRDWEVRGYDPGLTLDHLGTPTVGVGVDQFGTQLGGAISGYFSDLLGNRELAAAVQAQGSFKDTGGQLIYQDLEQRWNWGVSVSHIPYLTAAATQVRRGVPIEIGGRTVSATEVNQFRQRVFVSEASGMFRYPFSTTRRAELTGGYTRYGFDVERVQDLYVGRELIDSQTEDVDSLESDPLHLGRGAAALVGDNSFFGFTSPVRGGRYRLEVGATAGSVGFGTLLADWRRYFFFRPLTAAVRGYHFGRYGGDADEGVLQPLFLGYGTLVRGYSMRSFELSECSEGELPGVQPEQQSGCPEFDRLVGSRLAVSSFELRVPLFGVERFGLVNMPYLPTELVAFFDAGVAWRGDDSPEFDFARRSAERVPVFSTGLSARVNLLGYMVVEAYYAYPFQRPDKGAHFGFNLAPGW